MNEIVIKSLSVYSHIGVPDEERQSPQHLLIDATIEPVTPFHKLDDDITRTVDYDTASQRISALAGSHPRHLIETLALEIVELLLEQFPARKATVEIRKHILPDTEYVAVRCSRERKSAETSSLKTKLTV